MAIYSIEEIRKIQNKPFSFFTFSSSEFSLIIKLTIVSFLIGVVLQFISNILSEISRGILVPTIFIGFLLSIIIIKTINYFFGQGIVFFIFGDLKGFFKFFFKKKEKRKKIYLTKEV